MELIIFIVATIISVVYMKSVLKGEVSPESSLEGNEKIFVPLLTFFSPLIAGAIFYYGWKKLLPTKAKIANRISWIMFLLWIIINIAFAFIFNRDEISQVVRDIEDQQQLQDGRMDALQTSTAFNLFSIQAKTDNALLGTYEKVCDDKSLRDEYGAAILEQEDFKKLNSYLQEAQCADGTFGYVLYASGDDWSYCIDATKDELVEGVGNEESLLCEPSN